MRTPEKRALATQSAAALMARARKSRIASGTTWSVRESLARRQYWGDELRPACTPSASRERRRRRALRRAARRRRAGGGGRALASAFQPRVPANIRRVAPRIPADPPPRARGGAASLDRSHRGRHLLFGWPEKRRFFHDQLYPHLRQVTDRLPRGVSARVAARPDSDLRPARLRPSATPHVSRRHGHRPGLASASTVFVYQGGRDDQDRRCAIVGT